MSRYNNLNVESSIMVKKIKLKNYKYTLKINYMTHKSVRLFFSYK